MAEYRCPECGDSVDWNDDENVPACLGGTDEVDHEAVMMVKVA